MQRPFRFGVLFVTWIRLLRCGWMLFCSEGKMEEAMVPFRQG